MGSGAALEQVLWQRGLAGDSEAFAAIFDLYRDRVFRHAYRMLRDHADAEDAVAVSFLELWRRRSQVRLIDGSVLPWLLVTATNASRNLARSRRRYRRLLESLPHGGHHPSAEHTALSSQVDDASIAAALGQLSLKDARLFSLIALEGYPVADAARVLGITPGAARTRLHRIRASLHYGLGHNTLASYLTKEAT
jgi:RNA polymerase sigma-70 factor (ECF subfamily)